MTSTLQQEGGRKLRLGAAQVMRIAQGLYERGYITYMRTDNVVLSDEALGRGARRGAAHVRPATSCRPAPRQFSTKVKNAQEAHEAIRPTTPLRSPEQLPAELNGQELSLYRMIWQRTLASQMADATGTTVSVRLAAAVAEGGAAPHRLRVRGQRHHHHLPRLSPGVRRVAPTRPRARTRRKRCCRRSPSGDAVAGRVAHAERPRHLPPARYTEASLVKRLEELGIGRPSTWASIIQTIQDRGYVWKKGQALVPTWTAFAVVGLLEKHFDGLVDYAFTARIEEDLDSIARNERQKQDWLQHFYFGDEAEHLPGLKRLVEENLDHIDAAEINTFPIGLDPDGNEVVVKPGKYGPYVKRGDDTASVPDDLAPDELTVEMALKLLAAPKSDEPIGELDGFPVFAKNGRYGPYVQWGAPDNLPPGLDKPKMASLFKTMALERLTLDEARELLHAAAHAGHRPGRRAGDPGQQRSLRPVRAEGQGLPQHRQRGAVAHHHARRGRADLQPAEGVPPRRRRQPGREGPLREFGDDPVSGKAGGGQGRQVRRVRHRRRDQRLAVEGRPPRRDAARAGLRAAAPSAARRSSRRAARRPRRPPPRRRPRPRRRRRPRRRPPRRPRRRRPHRERSGQTLVRVSRAASRAARRRPPARWPTYSARVWRSWSHQRDTAKVNSSST